MKYYLLCSILFLCLCQPLQAQDSAFVNCGQKEANEQFLRQNPAAKRFQDQVELQVADYVRKVQSGVLTAHRTNAVVTLPVVVHIIHNNGAENISDARVMTAIQHLNEAFANTGYYDPANGVNTQIQFCLAQRDPSGNATNGITRNVSPYTVMGGPSYTSDDQNVKNLNRWDPNCYINIWLVRDIPGNVAGYAYLPSAHGSFYDGILMEASFFGSSYQNDVVIIHEMGHYLGLYHTFEGSCNNNDCTTQGDRVCDTPPDQSTAWASCNTSVNSCSTDPLSGFGTDVSDLKEDYMDYGNWDCMKVFTQGQADRMNWHIQNVRKSLLNCKSCLSPCPAPIVANFTASATTVTYGTTVNFTNGSTNASGYRWYINDVLQSTTTNFSYTFNAGGTFTIRLVALPGSPLCDSVAIMQNVNVICTAPVTAGFTSSADNVLIGATINFTNSSANAATYRWYINGVLQTTTPNFSNTFNTAGMYIIRLVAISSSPICDSAAIQDTVRVNCGVTANFSPLNSSFSTNKTVTFSNSSVGATSYEWFVNGALMNTAASFTHSFNTPGSYTVKLRAISAGCTDSLTGYVEILSDTCSERKNFILTIGNLGTDHGRDAISLPDGGTLIVGASNGNSSSNTDALVIRTDSRANIIWARGYGAAGSDVFKRVIPTRDGNYLAVGEGVFRPGTNADIYVVKFNLQGNVIWSKSYTGYSTNSEQVSAIVETPDGGFAIAGAYNSTFSTEQPLYLKIDANGNLVWSKLLSLAGVGHAVDIIIQGESLISIGQVSKSNGASTWYDGYIIKLRSSDGSIIWTRNIEWNGLSNQPKSLQLKNNQLSFTMFNSENWTEVNFVPIVFKTDTNGIVTQGHRYDITGIGTNWMLGSGTTTVDGGYLLGLSDGRNLSSPRFVKMAADGSLSWVKSYMMFASQVLANVKADNGGYLGVGIVNQDVLLIKTNKEGYSSCGMKDESGTVTAVQINSTLAGPDYWSGTSSGNIMMIDAVTNVNTHMFGSTIECIDSANCETPVDTANCNVITFQKTYTAPGTYHARYIHITNDGGSVIAGAAHPGQIFSDGPAMDAFVMKIEADGKLQWAKKIGGNNFDEFRKIKPAADGGYIAIGSTSSFGPNRGIYLVKFNAAGNVVWSRNYSGPNHDIGHDVIQTSDGGFVFTATNDAIAPNAHGLVAKTDAVGNITWYMRLHRNDGVNIHSVLEDADTLVLGANYWVAAETRYYGSIIKMRKDNGNIISSISFSAGDKGSFATEVYKTPFGFMVGTHLIWGTSYDQKQQGILRFTQNLELLSAQKLWSTGSEQWTDITPSRKGGYIATGSFVGTGNDFFLYKVDDAGEITWQKRYGNQAGMNMLHQFGANAQEYADGTIISPHTFTDRSISTEGKIQIIRTTSQGTTPGCLYGDWADIQERLTGQVTPIIWNNFSNFNYDPNTAVNSTVTEVNMDVTERCNPLCEIDTLIGTDTICSLNDTARYELKRTGACTQPVAWTIDPNFADIVHTTDTTVDLKFKKTGTVTLYARLNRNCDIAVDSITINVFHSPDTLNLGPDLMLCKISTWALNARSGFKSYLWQDGTTDSTFTIYDPGVYHVTVTDWCGNQLRDTVTVSLSPDIPFDLGPDIPICDRDTITINAPGGFSNYYWSPGYRVTNTYTSSIRVYPDRDTTYTVVAERAPGCLVTDTIRVIVRRTAPLDLGKDTSFCRKDSVLLDAGPAFNSYLWNNGLITQQIFATSAGDYMVEATDINGCKIRDTIAVTMNALPIVNLGGDTTLCRNTAVFFTPVVGGALHTFLWQDGSTNATFAASVPGTYWVQVTNLYDCKNSDTVQITGIVEPPSDFLADTIGVCDGEPIEIRANGNFRAYRWDNSITSASIMVDRPGVHILEVTDANGCTGIDSIRVYAKDCAKQIFFPNAFSPNNDGRHDIWKPIVRGRMASYHLVIYNRWGGKVFETYDTSLGWNGKLNHLQQGISVYVWMCTYKFIGTGQVEHKEKGTLTLVR